MKNRSNTLVNRHYTRENTGTVFLKEGALKVKVLLVTGGAGFIGSNFIRFFLKRNKNFIIVNIDKLIQPGSFERLREIENSPRHHFIKGDIGNHELVGYIFRRFKPEYIINFAVDGSSNKDSYHHSSLIGTNVGGVLTLMENARSIWSKKDLASCRFIQISSDEVYGNTLSSDEFFVEEAALNPKTPFAASKASADLILRSFSDMYDLPVMSLRCCNSYGPYQNNDFLIPSYIVNALNGSAFNINSNTNVREWLHVWDLSIAIIRTLFYGKPGDIYNIGSDEEISDLDLAREILGITGGTEDILLRESTNTGKCLRYALNSYKIQNNLRWKNKLKLKEGLVETVQWFRNNPAWWSK